MHRILLALVVGIVMAAAPAQAEPQGFGATVSGAFGITSSGGGVSDQFNVQSPREDTIAEQSIGAAGSALVQAAVNRGTTIARLEASNAGSGSTLGVCTGDVH
jgi:hypothetical protein